jgi:hypothetical protein
MGQVIFQCPNTGKDFASGFEASAADIKLVPRTATIRLHCKICGDTHEFHFVSARVDEGVNPGQESRS